MTGDLLKTPFPRVLWEIFSSRVSGALEVKKGEISKKIFFEDGHPLHAESNLLHETLGKFLVAERVITTDQEQAALVRSLEAGKPFGEALVELKAVEAAKLYEYLRRCLALKILDCFSWDKGHYSLDGNQRAPENAAGFRMNTPRLILKGVDTGFPFTRIETSGMALQGSFRAVSTPAVPLDQFQLSSEEVAVLQAMKSPVPAADLEARLKLNREAVLRKLYAFWVMGLVEEQKAGGETSLDELVGAALLAGLKPAEPERSVSEADEETQKLANEIATEHMRLLNLNYFELLGVAERAAAVEIRDRFVDFSARYNPGRFRTAKLGEFRDKGEEIFLRGVKAYAALSDFDSKTKYLDKLKAERKKSQEAGGKKKPGESFKIQTKLLDAGPQFEQGIRLMKDRKYLKAIEFFQYAADIDSRNPSFPGHIAWCTYQSAPERNRKSAEGIFKRALELGDEAWTSFFYGKFLNETGKTEEGLRHLKKAAELEPKNIDMVRELRAAERKKT